MSTSPDSESHARIRDLVESRPVLLFMKGTPERPQCGFSAQVAGLLRYLDVSFHAVDVLADPDMRAGIKTFSDWPTIPQLYVSGTFQGGCDIVSEMALSGELAQVLEEAGIPFDANAASALRTRTAPG